MELPRSPIAAKAQGDLTSHTHTDATPRHVEPTPTKHTPFSYLNCVSPISVPGTDQKPMTGGLPDGPPTPPYTRFVVWFLSCPYAGTN